jgi:hypothetical protein
VVEHEVRLVDRCEPLPVRAHVNQQGLGGLAGLPGG